MLTTLDKSAFFGLFNREGYVLDFSTANFDSFTNSSVGLSLCDHYNLSKGKSLEKYINDPNVSTIDKVKLLSDLIEYYELHQGSEIDSGKQPFKSYYTRCKKVINNLLTDDFHHSKNAENLKQSFSSEYFTSIVNIMVKMQEESPVEAIGKSKELIESCCKTILDRNGIGIDNNWSVSQLSKATMKTLKITTDHISREHPEGAIIRQILGNLQGIASSIAELRNTHGSGHGKSADYSGLNKRHAKLAVGSSITLVTYLWDTHLWRCSNE